MLASDSEEGCRAGLRDGGPGRFSDPPSGPSDEAQVGWGTAGGAGHLSPQAPRQRAGSSSVAPGLPSPSPSLPSLLTREGQTWGLSVPVLDPVELLQKQQPDQTKSYENGRGRGRTTPCSSGWSKFSIALLGQ
uniref:Uncharacterized protein n=1 Tax=Sphaerodactylus townsendi TaxID=933632 RepID=A0ACB8G7I7_9SAUR